MQLKSHLCQILVNLRELRYGSACSLTFYDKRGKCKARITDALVSVRVPPLHILGINDTLPLRSSWSL